MNQKISVIIPCYNCQKTIERTLLSVFAQTFLPFEIIVINDGSTDKTLQILENYTPQIQVISQKNQGVVIARELGLFYASGDFICFLDSDDILEPKIFEKQLLIFQKNPKIDVVYCNAKQVYENGKVAKIFVNPMQNKPELALIRDFWLPVSSYLFRQKSLHNIKINSDLQIFNDSYLVWLVAHRQNQFTHNSFMGTTYYIQQNSLSRKEGLLNYFVEKYKYLNVIEQNLDFEIGSETAKILTEAYRDCNRIFVEKSPILFEECTQKMYEISPNYIPKNSRKMNLLSRIFGYQKAEKIATLFRGFFVHLSL